MYYLPTSAARSLPFWAQVTSFAVATIGFIGTAFVGINEYLKTADLDVKLTKDTFYRIIDRGEAIFCRVTLIARNGPVLVRAVLFLWKKGTVPPRSFS